MKNIKKIVLFDRRYFNYKMIEPFGSFKTDSIYAFIICEFRPRDHSMIKIIDIEKGGDN